LSPRDGDEQGRASSDTAALADRPRATVERCGKEDMLRAMVPILLIRVAIALVWLYEGVWCKLLGRMPHQVDVVAAHPMFGPTSAQWVLRAIGALEVLLALWVLSGWEPWWAALVQTVVLVGMNANGVLFSREHIHDPAGMVVKNFALVVLMWVGALHGA
jgi:uncharacterized membrane protein YphA (DoxX/SURF4 family)